jgi:hypothetical protein
MRTVIRNDISVWTAENDLSAKLYYAVEFGATAGTVDVCDGATDLPLGVLLDPGQAAGDAVRVSGAGDIAIGIAGGAIAAGAVVGTTAAGKLVAKTTDEDYILGVLIDAAAADGDQVRFLQSAVGTQVASV